MQVTIKAHHVDITPALKSYAKKKLEKLERFFEHIQEILVDLDISDNSDENVRQVVSATIKASGTLIRATDATRDMYASIDNLFEKLEVQLKKYNEKLKNHKIKGRRIKGIRSVSSRGREKTRHDEVADLAEKHYVAKPMLPEEAAEIIEMETLEFLMFRNASTEEINVLYPRDGAFALIEP
jgi:putative sigma-54 modulation protein